MKNLRSISCLLILVSGTIQIVVGQAENIVADNTDENIGNVDIFVEPPIQPVSDNNSDNNNNMTPAIPSKPITFCSNEGVCQPNEICEEYTNEIGIHTYKCLCQGEFGTNPSTSKCEKIPTPDVCQYYNITCDDQPSTYCAPVEDNVFNYMCLDLCQINDQENSKRCKFYQQCTVLLNGSDGPIPVTKENHGNVTANTETTCVIKPNMKIALLGSSVLIIVLVVLIVISIVRCCKKRRPTQYDEEDNDQLELEYETLRRNYNQGSTAHRTKENDNNLSHNIGKQTTENRELLSVKKSTGSSKNGSDLDPSRAFRDEFADDDTFEDTTTDR